MTDEPLEVLITRKMPDGTYAVVNALKNLRPVQAADAAEKFIEEFYLARGVLRPHESKPTT
jgi:hypothetical protein